MSRSVEPVITVEHLHKQYGETVAVEDVSFEVLDGEIFGIIGPNGAGKTTSVECLQGLRRADSGQIRVLGLDPTHEITRLRPQIGAQLQASSLPDRIRVGEAVELFAAYAPKPINWFELLDQWNLTSLSQRAFGNLSGGQKQRLFLALAFVNDPKLVFLDELTQGLDPQSRRMTWELIRQIRQRGTTIVLVTHFMDEAEYLCDRVAIVDQGRVVALGTPQDIIDSLDVPLHVRFSSNCPDLGWLRSVSGVQQLSRVGDQVEIEGTGPVLALVASTLVAHDVVPSDLRVERPTLEDAFIAITGRAIGAAT